MTGSHTPEPDPEPPTARAPAGELRVLLAVPTRRDGEITAALLREVDLACVTCRNLAELAAEIGRGAGAVLATAEALAAPDAAAVQAALAQQPAWSDLPIVLLVRGGRNWRREAGGLAWRNVTLLERPAPTGSVISAVQAAIRARLRQYEIRDQLEALNGAKIERQALLESEQAARREAERVNRMKDEFLATLSHELRTPLNAIMGWTYVVRAHGDDPAARAEGIAVIERNVRIQAQLIDDLLDMNRIASGKMRLDVRAVDLGSVIEAALDSALPALTEKGLRLVCPDSAAPIVVRADPARLQQVFWNLLSNATKFTPAGGNVTVTVQRGDDNVCVAIADSGQGIAPEVLPLIFDRFVQADASTTRQHGGLGLGLSIVRGLVEMQGGSVEASSPGLGQGASFSVSLPLAPAADALAAPGSGDAFPVSQVAAGALSGLKILVVDDEPDSREMYRRVLAELAAEARMAASAAEAEDLLATFKPDLILSDIGMPVRDGYDFIRAVRKQGCQSPAIAVTAFARNTDRERSLQAGYQAHIAKPVAPAELISTVTRVLARAS